MTGAERGSGRGAGRDVLAVFALSFAVLAAFAWVRDLWDADEGRYAAVALDMVRAGDLVTPREAGMRFMDKPPLLYWGEAGAFALLGPTPFAARLPCLLAGAALCAIVFALALRWTADRRAAWLSAGIAATSAVGMGFSRLVTTDMPLAAAIAGALLAAHAALAGAGPGSRVALGAAVGLGLLAKGPLAAVVPMVVAVAWAVVGAPWRRVLRVAFSPLAWVVAFAIAAPWYALCERANPGYLEHFLVHEHFGRYAQEGHKQFNPFWMYVPILPLGLLPWTHLLLRARMRTPVDLGGARPVPSERLAWAWVLACLLFFSLGRNKLFTYVLPAFPPLFVLAGARLSERLAAGGPSSSRLAGWAFAAGAIVVAAGAIVASGLPFDRGWLQEERLRPIGVPAALAGLALLAMPLAFRLARSATARAVLLVGAAAWLWWGADLARAKADPLRSSRALAEVLVRERGPDDEVVVLDRYPQGLRFFSDLEVRIAENPLKPGQRHTQREIVEPWASRDGAGRLISMADLRAAWAGPRRVLLVAREIDARAEFPSGRVLADRLAGAERADLVVVENRPR